MKTVVLLSGGLDSAVLLFHLRAHGTEVRALSINYAQRHIKELDAACGLARLSDTPHFIADMSAIAPLLAGSALTSKDVPVPFGHYEDENMKQTVVPNRNMILLSLATAWAISLDYDSVTYAAHHGDHAIYPDCRAEFADVMEKAMFLCDWKQIEMIRPFISMSKADIVRRGAELEVPFTLTWSCYEGRDIHCGQCGTCVERREAFELAGIDDPTVYSS